MTGDSQTDLVRDPAVHMSIEDLVREHHKSLFAYAYRLSNSAVDAEDLTQQTFLISQQKLDQLRDPAKARHWLYRILRNQFLQMCRTNRPISESELSGKLLDTEPSEVDESSLDSEAIQIAIQNVPYDFRIVLLMFYFDELSYKQIAEDLNVPVGTVMSRLARAKALLRRNLAAREDGGKNGEERNRN